MMHKLLRKLYFRVLYRKIRKMVEKEYPDFIPFIIDDVRVMVWGCSFTLLKDKEAYLDDEDCVDCLWRYAENTLEDSNHVYPWWLG